MEGQINVPFTDLRDRFTQLSIPTETPTQYIQKPVGFTDADILTKRLYEDDHDYNTRINLNNKIRSIYGSSIDGPTIDMIVSALINKAKYGVQYPFYIENTIDLINKSLGI